MLRTTKPRQPRRFAGVSLPFALGLFAMASAGAAIGLALPDRQAGRSPNGGERIHFGLCHTGSGINCVVDGDTFYVDGQKVRIVDIDTPETHPARCAEEERLGNAATLRLQTLLNAGPIELVASADRDRDSYGRLLRTVERNGTSLGDVLIAEGLARPYANGRKPWC